MTVPLYLLPSWPQIFFLSWQEDWGMLWLPRGYVEEGFITCPTVGFPQSPRPLLHCPQPLLCCFWAVQFCPKLAHHCTVPSSHFSAIQKPCCEVNKGLCIQRILALISMSFGISLLTQTVYQDMACNDISFLPERYSKRKYKNKSSILLH